jgi:uncharacterized protein YjhX (UPF0386 family)
MKSAQCLTIDGWIKKTCHVRETERVAIKKNEIMSFSGK